MVLSRCIKKFASKTLWPTSGGNEVKLKQGAEVEVHVEADKSATISKK